MLLFSTGLLAHPMPNSVLQFDIKTNGVTAELAWPLKELQLAFPDEDIDTHPATLLQRKGPWLDAYLLQHMSVTDSSGNVWTMTIADMKVIDTQSTLTGPYRELIFTLWLQPPAGVSPRHFTMHYDAIIHQVVTHKLLISIRQDWDGGLSTKGSEDADLGIISMNFKNNTIPPLKVNLDGGSTWKGFKSMVQLGIEHIAEGTDHLLFLLVLLLPAPLLVRNKRWAGFGGTKYSVLRLLKITTAFTIGHSLTLLAGAAGWLRLPSQPVEILIAVSILVTAIHALRPLFPNKEIYVAAGFGLVHGLAFASTIANLHLDAGKMAISILGFNIGIELMQLFVITMVVPWLIILSGYTTYKWLRIVGSIFAAIAATAWIIERVTSQPNIVSTHVQAILLQDKWIVLGLVVVAMLQYLLGRGRRVVVGDK